MLRTHSHDRSNFIKITLKHIIPINISKSFSCLQHSSQHRNHRCFTCTVMPKQRKDLSFIHSYIYSIYRPEPVGKNLHKILYPQILLCFLNFRQISSRRFKILWLDVLGFKIHFHLLAFKSSFHLFVGFVVLHCVKRLDPTRGCFLILLTQIKAVPVRWGNHVANEIPRFLHTCFAWHNVVYVNS
jgi:hypothetical protein